MTGTFPPLGIFLLSVSKLEASNDKRVQEVSMFLRTRISKEREHIRGFDIEVCRTIITEVKLSHSLFAKYYF